MKLFSRTLAQPFLTPAMCLQVGRLIQAYQREVNREYEFVCFTRLDVAVMTPFSWHKILETMRGTAQIAVPNSQFWLGINDRFALGAGPLMLHTFASQFDAQHVNDEPFIFADLETTSEFALCSHLSRARLNMTRISIVPLPLCLLRVRPNREALMCDVDPHPALCPSTRRGGYGHGDTGHGPAVLSQLPCLNPPMGNESDVIWHPGSRQLGCNYYEMRKFVERESWMPIYQKVNLSWSVNETCGPFPSKLNAWDSCSPGTCFGMVLRSGLQILDWTPKEKGFKSLSKHFRTACWKYRDLGLLVNGSYAFYRNRRPTAGRSRAPHEGEVRTASD